MQMIENILWIEYTASGCKFCTRKETKSAWNMQMISGHKCVSQKMKIEGV